MKTKIPIISTRGYYDLSNGKKIKKKSYYLYPKKSFQVLSGKKEFVILIHGLRNNKASAIKKFTILKKRLKQLGYIYPVVGYSYDSNTKGAHLKNSALKALRIGQKIAKENGLNLSKFIIDFKKKNPHTKIRLVGHSLGTEVILNTIKKLASSSKNQGIIESVYFFGSSISGDIIKTKQYRSILHTIVRNKIKNYYSPIDDVLKQSQTEGTVKNPLGYIGLSGKISSQIIQLRVYPKNHRFVSYVIMLKSFP